MRSTEILFRRRPGMPMAGRIRQCVDCVLDQLGKGDTELHVLMTDDEEIRRQSGRFREAAQQILAERVECRHRDAGCCARVEEFFETPEDMAAPA